MVISWSVALVNSLQKHDYYKSRKVLEIVEYTVENKNDKRIAENTAFMCAQSRVMELVLVLVSLCI